MQNVTKDYYLQMLLSLLPEGKAWNIEPEGIFYQILETTAESFKNIHNKANDLVKEVNPYYTLLLLEEFERLLNLPEHCKKHPERIQNSSLQARRTNAANKYLSNRLNTVEYIKQYADSLGFDIEIDELQSARFGEPFSTFSSSDTAYVICIKVIHAEKVGSRFGDFFGQEFGLREQSDHIECELNKIIPAHLQVVYRYSD